MGVAKSLTFGVYEELGHKLGFDVYQLKHSLRGQRQRYDVKTGVEFAHNLLHNELKQQLRIEFLMSSAEMKKIDVSKLLRTIKRYFTCKYSKLTDTLNLCEVEIVSNEIVMTETLWSGKSKKTMKFDRYLLDSK